MNQYLTPEQRAAFERRLAQDDLTRDDLTREQREAAVAEGVEMARADLEDKPADALARSGFDSVDALLAAYEKSQADLSEAEEALRQAQALLKALRNGEALEAEDPEARSDAVRKTWTRRAGAMRDLEALLPDMAAYILDHPAIAMEEDGLERAYDAVRAARYRSGEELLGDPENVKRLAADPRVRDAVLTAHLAAVSRAGQEVPAFIGSGGGIPGETAKTPDSMAQAKAKLEALLKHN